MPALTPLEFELCSFRDHNKAERLSLAVDPGIC